MIPKNSIRNKVFEYVKENYGTDPEYLWEKTPEYAVLRRGDNSKWYAAVMNIPKRYLGIDSDEITDIINVKCDKLMLGSLLTEEGFYPAWHMNKNCWITAMLDGTVSESMIFMLTDMSFKLAGKKR